MVAETRVSKELEGIGWMDDRSWSDRGSNKVRNFPRRESGSGIVRDGGEVRKWKEDVLVD